MFYVFKRICWIAESVVIWLSLLIAFSNSLIVDRNFPISMITNSTFWIRILLTDLSCLWRSVISFAVCAYFSFKLIKIKSAVLITSLRWDISILAFRFVIFRRYSLLFLIISLKATTWFYRNRAVYVKKFYPSDAFKLYFILFYFLIF
jgi:hypothetical protein